MRAERSMSAEDLATLELLSAALAAESLATPPDRLRRSTSLTWLRPCRPGDGGGGSSACVARLVVGAPIAGVSW